MGREQNDRVDGRGNWPIGFMGGKADRSCWWEGKLTDLFHRREIDRSGLWEGKLTHRVDERGTDRSGWWERKLADRVDGWGNLRIDFIGGNADRSGGWEGNWPIGLMGGKTDRLGSWEWKLTDRVHGKRNWPIVLMGGETDRSGWWEGKLTDRVDGRRNTTDRVDGKGNWPIYLQTDKAEVEVVLEFCCACCLHNLLTAVTGCIITSFTHGALNWPLCASTHTDSHRCCHSVKYPSKLMILVVLYRQLLQWKHQ